ncbi:MAG: DinB family protein [Acidobacteria bacterium]|nr:MAG: DinB family protein [Acidobacteriota bacterium]
MMSKTEPWLSGSRTGISPFLAPLLYSFDQAREDLERFTEGLTSEQIWAQHGSVNPVGREVRHIGGAVDRLMTYLQGRQLDERQLGELQTEFEAGASRKELLAGMDAAFRRAEAVVRSLDPTRLTELREVGRKRLPTTVIGLVVHIAEHTQRHVGQAIVAAKLARMEKE